MPSADYDTGTTDYTFYLPYGTGDCDFVVTNGSQTITGTKTFSAQVNFANGTTYNVSSTGTGTFNSLEAKGNLYADQRIVGKAGTVSTGNYTTTAVSSWAAGVTGQIMFALE